MTRLYFRYAALLAESRSCTERRANPSFHPRPAASTLFSDTSQPKRCINEKRFPQGSGGLTQMEGAVSTKMPYKDENKTWDPLLREDKENRASDGVGSDPLGDKLYIDAASVTINAEYETDVDNPLGDDGLGQDKSDSSCWRPELPPTALLEYIKSIATQRFIAEMKSPSLLSTAGSKNQNLHELKKEVKCLENSLSSSALVAVGILVEELTRECMVSWSRKNQDATQLKRIKRSSKNRSIPEISNSEDSGNISEVANLSEVIGEKRKIDDVIGTGPLGPVTKRSIRIEARLQLQGAIFKPDLSDSNSDDDDDGDDDEGERDSDKHVLNKGRNKDQRGGNSRENDKIKYVTSSLLRNRLEVRFIFEHSWQHLM